MKQNNVPVTFTQCYQQLNDYDVNHKNSLSSARMSVLTHQAVSYEEFGRVYNKYYTEAVAKQITEHNLEQSIEQYQQTMARSCFQQNMPRSHTFHAAIMKSSPRQNINRSPGKNQNVLITVQEE